MYEELIKALRNCDYPESYYYCGHGCNLSDGGITCGQTPLLHKAADAIEELSKERKTGEWCADYDGYSDGEPVYDMWWCSECGTYCDEWDDKPTWNFCPNCGADMRPRPKEENQ